MGIDIGYIVDSAGFFTDVHSAESDRPPCENEGAQRQCVSQAQFPKQESGVPTVETQHKQLHESRALARTLACESLRQSKNPLRESVRSSLKEYRVHKGVNREPPKRLEASKGVHV